ncbi:hypothetical protein SBA3_2530004 [Candidatus Sulfopaludibacter sp. SbA3]|nr:hypothetical protein SBA3_2530004 [Candidatus Sulfopaludibacter sp. SbA3]
MRRCLTRWDENGGGRVLRLASLAVPAAETAGVTEHFRESGRMRRCLTGWDENGGGRVLRLASLAIPAAETAGVTEHFRESFIGWRLAAP